MREGLYSKCNLLKEGSNHENVNGRFSMYAPRFMSGASGAGESVVPRNGGQALARQVSQPMTCFRESQGWNSPFALTSTDRPSSHRRLARPIDQSEFIALDHQQRADFSKELDLDPMLEHTVDRRVIAEFSGAVDSTACQFEIDR